MLTILRQTDRRPGALHILTQLSPHVPADQQILAPSSQAHTSHSVRLVFPTFSPVLAVTLVVPCAPYMRGSAAVAVKYCPAGLYLAQHHVHPSSSLSDDGAGAVLKAPSLGIRRLLKLILRSIGRPRLARVFLGREWF